MNERANIALCAVVVLAHCGMMDGHALAQGVSSGFQQGMAEFNAMMRANRPQPSQEARAKAYPRGMARRDRAVEIRASAVVQCTAFACAIEGGNIDEVDAFLRAGIDVNDIIVADNWGGADIVDFEAISLAKDATFMKASSFGARGMLETMGYFVSLQPAKMAGTGAGAGSRMSFSEMARQRNASYGSGMPAQGFLLGTPLMIAARSGSAYMVQELMRRGANPNIFIRTRVAANAKITAKPGSCRPWMCALKETFACNARNSEKIAKALIKGGAVFPSEDSSGRTVLWDALETKSAFLLDIALKNGVDPTREDHTGRSFIDCLNGMDDRSVADLFCPILRKYGFLQMPAQGLPPPSADFKTIPIVIE